jgi:hypothetical protein
VIGRDARLLAAYLVQQHHEATPLTAPLFCKLVRGHGDRLARLSVHAINYWLFELRLRARRDRRR